MTTLILLSDAVSKWYNNINETPMTTEAIATVGTGGAGAPAGAVLKDVAAPGLIATFFSIGTATTAIGIAVAIS